MADLKSIFFVGLLIVLMAALVLTIYHCVAGQPLSPPPTGEEPAGSVVISAALLLPPARSYGKGEGMVYGGDSMCPVCLCDFKDGDAVRQLPECLHYFHSPCIDTWFRSHSNCPICRTETAPFPPPEVRATADVRR